MSSSTKQPLPFLDLTGEIRNLIYGYCFLPKTMGKPQQEDSVKGQNYRGTSKILRLCKQAYNECHHTLHDRTQTLQLTFPRPPLAPSHQGPLPLFRLPRTKYKSSINVFTCVEFRRFTNIVLEIDYPFLSNCLKSGAPIDEMASRDLEQTLWVLKGSHSLKTLRVRLNMANPGGWYDPYFPGLHDYDPIMSLLAPILRLGGPATKIRAENSSGLTDPVVNWINESRLQWEAEQENLGLHHVRIPIFPPGFKFYAAVERSRFMRREGTILLDVQKLFGDASYPDQPIHTQNFKCCECSMAFESEKELSSHKHAFTTPEQYYIIAGQSEAHLLISANMAA